MENTDEDEHCKNKPTECEKKPQIEVKKDDCEIISIKKGNTEDHLRIKCVHCSQGENCSPDSYDEKPLTKEEEDRKGIIRLYNQTFLVTLIKARYIFRVAEIVQQTGQI